MEEFKMNLMLFDEGGAGGEAGGTATGADGTAEAQGETRDFDTEFEAMIKGDYKDSYDKRVQQVVKDRLKGSKQTEAKLKDAEGLLAMVAERYGQDGKDLSALREALESDIQYLQDEALEKGMSVEQLADMKRMERENRMFREQQNAEQERREFEQRFAAWNQEAEMLKTSYPELNLAAEFENPEFVRMLDSGVSVKAAYQAAHFDELVNGAMSYTASQAQKRVMDGVRANGARPSENGTKGGGAAREKLDVTKLTKEQRRELATRAIRNPDERITFS